MVGLLSQGDPAPAGDPPAGDPPVTPPAGDPPAGDPPSGGTERPDWLPEELWGEQGFNADAFEQIKAGKKADDLPADADAYVLPDIEGFNKDVAAASPILKVLRSAAFDAGMGQEGFNGLIKSYVEGEATKASEQMQAEMTALGANAKARISAVNTFIRSALPKEEADALAASVTSAKAVMALEKLMATGKPGGGGRGQPTPPPTRKSREEIDKLMASPAYSGKEADRDPKVIKEVEDWFQAEYGQKK